MEWDLLLLGISLGLLADRLLVLRKLKALDAQASILLKRSNEAIKKSDEITERSKRALRKIEALYEFSNN